jgi:hypothetical protein
VWGVWMLLRINSANGGNSGARHGIRPPGEIPRWEAAPLPPSPQLSRVPPPRPLESRESWTHHGDHKNALSSYPVPTCVKPSISQGR